MKHDLFTYPFTVGMLVLFLILAVRYFYWLRGLSHIDKLRIRNGLFTSRTLHAVTEVFMESLLHRRIFRVHPLLGYMHMSFALGWLLLILVGHMETLFCYGSFSFPFYMPIFFRYFLPASSFPGEAIFSFTMDLLLLFVLTGVLLAWLKRFRSRLFGMKKTTRLKLGDRIALISLWGIFPLRLLAESASASANGSGSFLTASLGSLMAGPFADKLLTPLWWSYSISLCLFFIALPFSRYMHIPTEVFLIFLRNYGIRVKKEYNAYSAIQVHSCSRCGICLDSCQLFDAQIRDTQSVYVLKQIREHSLTDEKLFNCLLCGSCQEACPVGINLTDIRISQRIASTKEYNSTYDYLKIPGSVQRADVVFFAGCMSHLTPRTLRAMDKIFTEAGIRYWFMDRDKAACCGRPLMQAGQYEAAQKLVAHNRERIIRSGARQLVVSCPICYKVFKEDYYLEDIEVLHHSEYILELVKSGRLQLQHQELKVSWHDPCELGRGSKIYEAPRELIAKVADLLPLAREREHAVCCGGSLGNLKVSYEERVKIRDRALSMLLEPQPDMLVTACPLCKKTFNEANRVNVTDIAELVAAALYSDGGMKEEPEVMNREHAEYPGC